MSHAVQDLPGTAPDVVFSRVREGGVLLSTEDEVYYGLNEVGAEVWESLEREETVQELLDRLEDRYPGVDPGRVRADVDDLLRRLAELGLLAEEAAGEREDASA